MENNTVEGKSIRNTSHYCDGCSTWMAFNTTEEISDENNTFLYLVYICPNCENKIYVLDSQKEYFRDIFDHLQKNILIG